MLRLLSSKAQGGKDFCKPSKPCLVGVHWIALTEYSQMSTHVPVFQSFLRFFTSFCIGQISHQQHILVLRIWWIWMILVKAKFWRQWVKLWLLPPILMWGRLLWSQGESGCHYDNNRLWLAQITQENYLLVWRNDQWGINRLGFGQRAGAHSPVALTHFCLTILAISFQPGHFRENIWIRNVHHNLTYYSPSNSLRYHSSFLIYLRKYDFTRRHTSRSLGIGSFVSDHFGDIFSTRAFLGKYLNKKCSSQPDLLLSFK